MVVIDISKHVSDYLLSDRSERQKRFTVIDDLAALRRAIAIDGSFDFAEADTGELAAVVLLGHYQINVALQEIFIVLLFFGRISPDRFMVVKPSTAVFIFINHVDFGNHWNASN